MYNNVTNKFMLILQFNVNGLKNNINELKIVLHHKRIDIIFMLMRILPLLTYYIIL